MSDRDANHQDVFPGDSAAARLMRAHDWASTPLGFPATWPQALKVPLRMLLESRFEMWIGWGPELLLFYNDAYAPTLGTKLSYALGRPIRELWSELTPALGDRLDRVMRDGVSTWDKSLMLLVDRNGYLEESYHSFSYSPLRDDEGAVRGMMCIVSEDTEEVLSQRRLGALRALATALLPVRTRAELADVVPVVLGQYAADFPFVALHFLDEARHFPVDPLIDMQAWPFDAIAAGTDHVRVPIVDAAGPVPCGDWNIPPDRALIVPVLQRDATMPSAALLLGLNPYRPEDDGVLPIARLLAQQIASALTAIDARLREAAETDRLRLLFNQSPSFIAVLTGPDHVFEMVNPGYQQLIGHRQVIGRAIADVIPEVMGQSFGTRLGEVYASGRPYVGQSMPLTIQRTSGAPPEDRVVDLVYQPVSEHGVVTRIFVEGIDVTAAHDAVTALRESEARFRMLAEAMPNHVWTAAPDGQIEWYNDRTYAYTGLPRGELEGDGWAKVVHPDDLALASSNWADAFNSGTIYTTDLRMRRFDGAMRWHIVNATAVRGENGEIVRWIGTNTDIDDQKSATQSLAEEIVRERRERDRLWRNSEDLLVVYDDRGRFQATNPAMIKVLGWTPQDLAGLTAFDLIHPEDLEAAQAALAQALSGSLSSYECRFRHKDGGFRWLSWAAGREGDTVYATGRHITAQKDAAEALQRAEAQLRQAQKMEAVGQLTGGIAHDFNNLLASISGSLDLMQIRMAQGRVDELDRFINAAQSASRRAAALTHRLLAFSRRQTLDPRSTSVNRLVRGMEDMIRRTVGPGISVEVVTAGGLWHTLVDPHQLDNALLNLCINARDAMPDGGRITIETANRWLDAHVAREQDLPPGQYVSLCVSDNGTGMPPEVISRAFEPFYTTKPIGEGTGLGLSMIYGFARQSGGHVRIYSEVGEGTMVCLYLPRAEAGEEEGEDAAGIAPAPRAEAGERVLVIDDEPGIRMLVVAILEDLGYSAIEAGTGRAGLKLLEEHKPIDLLITDIGLPQGMNGRQVADAARELQPELKVLFITGYAENALIGNGQIDRGMHVMTKPFPMDALATRIREIIEGS